MKKFLDWMSNVFAPKLEKAVNNPWVAALHKSIIKTLPMIFVGSLVTVYNVLREYLPKLPDLSPINTYTFGLISIFIVFLIPYYLLEQKKADKMKLLGGATGIALLMISINPTITDEGYVYSIDKFGAAGMIVAIVAGLFTAFIMNLFAKHSFFKEDSVLPDFVKEWFDSMLPIALVVTVGWLVVIQCGFDIYEFVQMCFKPVASIAQSYPGVLLLYMVPILFYSMGISAWAFQPITAPIALSAIAANAAGGSAVFCYEADYLYLSIGGMGTTLPLILVLMLFCKSRRYKAIGRASLAPGLLNINEPVVFGVIAWNPILMIAMWVTTFLTVTVTYVAMHIGFIAYPNSAFNLWYCPPFLATWLGGHSISGIFVALINFGIAFFVYFIFGKAADAQEVKKEQEALAEKAA